MAGRFTFTIIKPSAVARLYVGPILSMINEAGFRIIAMKMTKTGRGVLCYPQRKAFLQQPC